MTTTNDIEQHAERLYTVYCQAVGGKAYDGRPLPPWQEFSTDPGKQTQANGWRALGKMEAELEAEVALWKERSSALEAGLALHEEGIPEANAKRIKELEEAALAGWRLAAFPYGKWEHSGGRVQCIHGYAKGLTHGLLLLESELNEIRHAVQCDTQAELQAARAEVDSGRKRIAEMEAALRDISNCGHDLDEGVCASWCSCCKATKALKGGQS